MGSFMQSWAVVLSLWQPIVAALVATPHYFRSAPFTRRSLSVLQVQQELGTLVSFNTTIFGPGDVRFANATERYSTHAVPDIEVVVVPATEDDVSTIVLYCSENSIDFLAVNRAHARTYSVGNFTGLMIDLAGLTDIEIQPGSKTAWFQGGTYDGQVMEYLWERGYVATTGSCDCVGMMGPGLGGGHGRHQGLYGLISDNLVNLNVVLANGTAIVVNETSNSYLFWAMKGAGHNFGIVTSFELNIYPREVDTWHYHNYIWTQEKLEELFTVANEFQGDGDIPVNMTTNFVTFMINETISATEAVIFWTFAYRGSASEAEALLAPFNNIEAVYDEMGDVSLPDISIIQGTSEGTASCAPNHTWITSTAGIKTYNITTTRQIYALNNAYIQQYPQLQSPSVVQEGYSNAAVRSIPAEDSAFPFREYNILTSFQVEVPTENDDLRPVARQWADDIQNLWNGGQPEEKPSNYVNYATGFESLPSMYGYESWRLERLVALKAAYDPLNRFRFYNPIVQD